MNSGIYRLTVLLLGVAMMLLLVPGNASAQLADPLLNGGFEQEWTTTDKAFDWQDYQGGYSRVNNGMAHSGSWVMRVDNRSLDTSAGGYQRIDLNQTTQNPVFVGGFVRGNNVTGGEGWQIGASLYAEIHMTDGSVAYWNSIANLGSFGWRWIGFNTGTLAHVDKPISHIFVVPIISNATGVAEFDDVVVAEYVPTQSAVTFMFDDGETNTYTEAKPVLDEYGFVASSAVVSGFIGNDGYMNRSQVVELSNSGWEIVSHSITHEDLTLMSPLRANRELRNSKLRLERIVGKEVKNFAFPFGTYNGELLAMADQYYSSARIYEQGNNPQGMFPYDVKVRSVEEQTTLEEIQGWISDAQANGEWVILTFHSIAETGDDRFHTTPEAYKAIVDYVAGTGVDVVTYDEGIGRFGSVRTESVVPAETPAEEPTTPTEEETTPAEDSTPTEEESTPTEEETTPVEDTTPTEETETPTEDTTQSTLQAQIQQQRDDLRAQIEAKRALYGI